MTVSILFVFVVNFYLSICCKPSLNDMKIDHEKWSPLIHDYKDLLFDRCGDIDNSNMITAAILDVIQPNTSYKIANATTAIFEKIDDIQNNNNVQNNKESTKYTKLIPPHIEIIANWIDDDSVTIKNQNANIFGKFGNFLMSNNTITIPISPTTPSNLAYYNVDLYAVNDIISPVIDNDILILSINEMGKNYIDGYIMDSERGGGVYLEYHDTPHMHSSMCQQEKDCHGYMIYGKQVDDKNIFHLSAFKIPFGYLLYTKPYTLHNDCFLIGKYLVGYTMANKHSTVLLKQNNTMDIVRVIIA